MSLQQECPCHCLRASRSSPRFLPSSSCLQGSPPAPAGWASGHELDERGRRNHGFCGQAGARGLRASTSLITLSSAEFQVALDPRPENRAQVRKVVAERSGLLDERVEDFGKTRDEKTRAMMPAIKETISAYKKDLDTRCNSPTRPKEVQLSEQIERLRASAMKSQAVAGQASRRDAGRRGTARQPRQSVRQECLGGISCDVHPADHRRRGRQSSSDAVRPSDSRSSGSSSPSACSRPSWRRLPATTCTPTFRA